MAAVSGTGYTAVDTDSKLREKLEWFFGDALKNQKLIQLQDIKTIAGWHKGKKEEKKEERNIILSTVLNKMVQELLKQVQPAYTAFLLQNIGIKTQFKEGAIEADFEIGFIPIKPYVEFLKVVNKVKVSSVKFTFQLDTSTYIEKLKIIPSSNHQVKSVHIEKMGIALELSLLEIKVSSLQLPMPSISLDQKIKLGEKKFELKDLSYQFKQPPATDRVEVQNSIVAGETNSRNSYIVCEQCGNRNSFQSKFCNNCGSKLQGTICQNCSSVNTYGATFCSKCGLTLS
jgi:ribosomal protein L40E